MSAAFFLFEAKGWVHIICLRYQSDLCSSSVFLCLRMCCINQLCVSDKSLRLWITSTLPSSSLVFFLSCSWLSVFFHPLYDVLLIVPWWHLFMWFHHSNVVYIWFVTFLCSFSSVKIKIKTCFMCILPLSDLTVMHLCLWQWPIHPFFWLLLELGELITGTQEANGEHKVGQAQEKRSGDSQVLACFWGLH